MYSVCVPNMHSEYCPRMVTCSTIDATYCPLLCVNLDFFFFIWFGSKEVLVMILNTGMKTK